MLFDPQAGVTKITQALAKRPRKHGRVELEDTLTCDLGPVLDLSGGGMRILCKRVPKEDRFTCTLWDWDERIEVRVRVAWTNRLGMRKHELGLAFEDVSPEIKAKLTKLSANHRLRRAI